MHHHLHHVLGVLLNQPLFAHPTMAMTVYNVLSGRAGLPTAPIPIEQDYGSIVGHIESMRDRPLVSRPNRTELQLVPDASRFSGSLVVADDSGGRSMEPYLRSVHGTAIITVTGSLVNRGAYVGASSGVTSYEGIDYQLTRAARDEKSKAILLDISSPGGEAMGNTEVSSLIRKIRETKPVYGIANSLAASAGFALLASCTEVFGTPSALVGSIGCILLHLDMTEKAKMEGVVPTIISAGDHKTDGHPLASLTPEALAELRAGVSSYYGLFLEAVAAGRGAQLDERKARETQARTYVGREAVKAGLLDDVGTFAELLEATDAAAQKKSGRKVTAQRGGTMSLLHSHDAAAGAGGQPAATPNSNGGPVASDPASIAAYFAEQSRIANEVLARQQAAAPAAAPPAPTPGAGAPLFAAPPPAPAPAAAAGIDARTNAIMDHAVVAQYPHILRSCLDLARQAPNMSAEQVIQYVAGNSGISSGHHPAPPAPPAAASPANAGQGVYVHGHGWMVPAAPPAPPMHGPGSGQSPTQALQQRVEASGVGGLSGAGAHTPAPPAHSNAPGTITTEMAPWDKHVDATNARSATWPKSHNAVA